MNPNDVDYAFLLNPPVMRDEHGSVAQSAADYRAWFRALLCENAATKARLDAEDAHIDWMREQVKIEDVA